MTYDDVKAIAEEKNLLLRIHRLSQAVEQTDGVFQTVLVSEEDLVLFFAIPIEAPDPSYPPTGQPVVVLKQVLHGTPRAVAAEIIKERTGHIEMPYMRGR